jgi:phage gp36-like protein
MYCTPVQLADAKLARELAQVATPESAAIIGDALMEATLRGTSRAAFESDDIALADRALAHIETALRNADGVIDGFLRARKPAPYVVPLDPVPEIVSTWARQIARYLLHPNRAGTTDQVDPIVRDYRDALKFLQAVADNKFSLGADDPLPLAGAGAPLVCAPERIFTQDTLRDYGT